MKVKHQITIEFVMGEKCFCCNEQFDKDTKIVRTFDTKKEADEFMSSCMELLPSWKKYKQINYNQLLGG